MLKVINLGNSRTRSKAQIFLSKPGSFGQQEDVSEGYVHIMLKDDFSANRTVKVWQQVVKECSYQWAKCVASDLGIVKAILSFFLFSFVFESIYMVLS